MFCVAGEMVFGLWRDAQKNFAKPNCLRSLHLCETRVHMPILVVFDVFFCSFNFATKFEGSLVTELISPAMSSGERYHRVVLLCQWGAKS